MSRRPGQSLPTQPLGLHQRITMDGIWKIWGVPTHYIVEERDVVTAWFLIEWLVNPLHTIPAVYAGSDTNYMSQLT